MRHRETETINPQYRDSKTKTPRHRETETVNLRYCDSKTFFKRAKSHGIEIPRLKSDDIEFPQNSSPYAP